MSCLLTPEGDHEVRGLVPRCQGKHYSIQSECEVIVAGGRGGKSHDMGNSLRGYIPDMHARSACSWALGIWACLLGILGAESEHCAGATKSHRV